MKVVIGIIYEELSVYTVLLEMLKLSVAFFRRYVKVQAYVWREVLPPAFQ